MDISCDITDKDKQLSDAVIEECVDNCSTVDEQEVETRVRNGNLLRTHDSDDEMDMKVESEDKTTSEVKREDQKTDPKETVVSFNSTGDSLDKMAVKSKDNQTIRLKKKFIRSAKWGESVGITDAKGRPKRIVNLSEVKNFIPLRMRFNSQFKFYFSIVDFRYPQLFRAYDSGEQRWRMRYGVFVDGLFGPNNKNDSVVHIGEIMVYFDIGMHYSQPFYVNCSFYANYTPLNRNVDAIRLTKMIVRLHDILTSNLILQLKFPIDDKLFRNIDYLYYKFFSRQNEMLNELDFLQNNKYWIHSSKWPSGDTNHAFPPNYGSYGRTQYDHRFRDTKNRPKASKRNAEDNTRPPGAHNEYRYQRSDEKTIHSTRRNVNSSARQSTRRPGEKVWRQGMNDWVSDWDQKGANDKVSHWGQKGANDKFSHWDQKGANDKVSHWDQKGANDKFSHWDQKGANDKVSHWGQKGANDKNLSKSKKSSQRKSQTFGRMNAMKENNYPIVIPSHAFRNGSFPYYEPHSRAKRRQI